MKKTLLLVVIVLFVLATNAIGQQTKNTVARFTVIVPKDDKRAEFDAGYKRHLQWHIDNGDRWNWYGWYISSGNRLRNFVDATFGHTWAELDKPIDPAKDRGDVAVNVIPYVESFSQFVCSLLPEVSKQNDTDLSAKMPQLIWFTIKPGHELDFETFLMELHKDWQKMDPSQHYLWFRVEDGGTVPQYFLFLPTQNFADREASHDFLLKLWARNSAAKAAFQASVESMISETWGYRADMTFIPR